MGNFWLLKIMHKAAAGLIGPDGKFKRDIDVEVAADWLAMSTGPGPAQFTPSGKLSYPESARHRIKDYGMSEKIRIYRESVAFGVWEKSLETVVALSEIPATKRGSGAGLFEDGPPGALQAPATLVLGKRDRAFEPSLCWDGIDDYLTRGSQVLTIEKSGHWLPHEKLGSEVIQVCVEWALGGEERPLKGKFAEQADVKFVVDK
jgi:pimeloyl-ACP methyl ester carboxylesterase